MINIVQSQSILILEKDPDLFDFFEPVLKSEGHSVWLFRSGSLLVNFMDEATGNSTGLIIINADCLAENIADVIRKAKQKTHVTDILVLSKHCGHLDVVTAMREQASDYLLRPDNLEELIPVIRNRLANLMSTSLDLYDKYIVKHKPARLFLEESLGELKERILRYDATRADVLDREFQLFGNEPATVLIAEDEPDFRKNLKSLLRHDFTILEAKDGQEAVDQVQAHPEIDIVLLDIHLPKMKGSQVLPLIKKINPKCEVVILTGFEETDIALDAFKNGASDYLNKPSDNADILAKIREAVVLRQNKQVMSIYLPLEMRLNLFDYFFAACKKANRRFTEDDLCAFFHELRSLDRAKKANVIESMWTVSTEAITDFTRSFVDQKIAEETRQEEAIQAVIKSGKSWCEIEAEFLGR